MAQGKLFATDLFRIELIDNFQFDCTDAKHRPAHVSTSKQPPIVLAAFDIGSNSVKMTVGRVLPNGEIEEFLWRAETTRLSDGIDKTGRIADERAEQTMEALERFALEARQLGAVRLIGVATEAVRIASNGRELLDRILEDTGIEVKEISGDLEAQMTFEGLDPRVSRNGQLLVADVGGGSTELIEARDGAIISSRSLPLGSGRLTDRFVGTNPPSSESLASVRNSVHDSVAGFFAGEPIDRLVVVGGTAEYLRRLLPADWPAETEAVELALQRTQELASPELATLIEASEARARVLPAGIATIAEIAAVVQPTEIVGAASGIRLGLLKAAAEGAI